MSEGRDRGDRAIVRAVREAYDDLVACADLRPGPRVDDVFRRLVRLVVEPPPDQAARVLDHPEVRPIAGHLRELSFEGEYQLERAWAQRIAAGERPHAELGRFPYADNYRRLGEMERDAVATVGGLVRRGRRDRPVDPGIPPDSGPQVAFVGSGPLPLTAFQLAADGAARVDNLDRDADALALSRRVADALEVTGLGFRHVDVGSAPPDGAAGLARYDMVVLAALVGLTPADKARVLAHLASAMAPGALLLVRSARGLRTLLYPEVELEALAGFDVLDVVHPTDEVINSVIVARKPEDR